MKKGLNFLLAFVTMLFIALQIFVSLNITYDFVDLTEYLEILTQIYTNGPIILLGLFMIVNVFGKGFVRVIISFLSVLVVAAYIIVRFFPDIVTTILPL
jgi:hypothetical protein